MPRLKVLKRCDRSLELRVELPRLRRVHGSGDALENFLFLEEIEVGGEALGDVLCAKQDADLNVSFVGSGGEVGGGNPSDFTVGNDTFRVQCGTRGRGMVQ